MLLIEEIGEGNDKNKKVEFSHDYAIISPNYDQTQERQESPRSIW